MCCQRRSGLASLTFCLLVCLASPGLHAATYYVSTTGNDSASGASGAPWKTIQRAIDRKATPSVQGGDTVLVEDGAWTTNVRIDCSAAGTANNGAAGQPITIKAVHERQARLLQQSAAEDVFHIQSCSYWNVEGLHMEGISSSATCPKTSGVLINVSDSRHIVARRNIVNHLNGFINIAAIFVGYDSDDVLIEENEVYGIGQEPCADGCNCNNKAIQVYMSTKVEVRRNYVNQRNAISDLLEQINPYPASGALFENNIVEGGGIAYSVNPNAYGANSDDNRFLGNIALKNAFGYFWADRCHGLNPCDGSGGGLVRNTHYKDNVVVGASIVGTYDRGGWNIVIENHSEMDGAKSGYLYSVDTNNDNEHATTKTTITNYFDAGPSSSISVSDGNGFDNPPFTFSCDFCMAKSFTPSLPNSHFTNSGTTVPTLIGTGKDQCVVYVPGGNGGANPKINGQSSNMAGTGKNGADIGANIIYRYEGGVLTKQPLWDQLSGAFPCGAIVKGLNDVAGKSCFDVHQRLNVGSNGCPIPKVAVTPKSDGGPGAEQGSVPETGTSERGTVAGDNPGSNRRPGGDCSCAVAERRGSAGGSLLLLLLTLLVAFARRWRNGIVRS